MIAPQHKAQLIDRMENMIKMKKIIITSGLMVLTIAVALTWVSTDDKIEYFDAQVILPKEELVPEALAVTSTCNASITDVQSKSNFVFKKLHILPTGYTLQDSDVIDG